MSSGGTDENSRSLRSNLSVLFTHEGLLNHEKRTGKFLKFHGHLSFKPELEHPERTILKPIQDVPIQRKSYLA